MAMIPELAQHRADLEQLCRNRHVRRLELFGSAVHGTYHVGESDLDFLVEFDQVPQGTYADNYFGLLEALEHLFARPVDLVVASASRTRTSANRSTKASGCSMRLEVKKYLYDIERAAALLTEFTAGRTFDDYTRDAMLRAASEREFEIIGEALAHLAKLDEQIADASANTGESSRSEHPHPRLRRGR
jgi:predicted nucleotidyltransferase